jgi:hypothetical protein
MRERQKKKKKNDYQSLSHFITAKKTICVSREQNGGSPVLLLTVTHMRCFLP